MDQVRSAELQYRIQHHHEGEWVDLAPEVVAPDAAESDPERSWIRRLVFRCTYCDEALTLAPHDPPNS